ncbi:Oidioi.mRNA.OKI2018_I69.chr2.g5690.t1.cds [Oikopleura dioica]|uniref:Oidioi.mRNA.OKI2018_I69.chr2.g5690.t1.cds n=1 Tax=Oikopleura dioica TaxID=34765 RepID=A0ABN7T4B3_OIKDI|nr:Oidioi.mRNA.OKI2018_I69.chr2.g5690.t1.cds [Oikopleura dioica]
MEKIPKSYTSMSEDQKQLYQLTRHADVNIDPTLFGNILQFLEADVHPEAICKMLKDTVPKSPYGDEKNQEKIERMNRRRSQKLSATSSSDESKKKFDQFADQSFHQPPSALLPKPVARAIMSCKNKTSRKSTCIFLSQISSSHNFHITTQT